MRRIGIVLGVGALLTACVTSERWTFERANTSPEQVKKDSTNCFAQSLASGEADREGFARADKAHYRACMEGRGYTVKTASE
jgi:hypothetical protein